MPDRLDTGHSFVAIDIKAIMPIREFKDRMDRMIRRIKESPKAKGSERIYLPGEMEWERREEALKNGIPLPAQTLTALSTVAANLGLSTAKLFQ